MNGRMMKLVVPVFALLASTMALAYSSPAFAGANVEASMLVTGLIAVNPDGSVYGYSLDQRNKLPAAVIQVIGETLPRWNFTPVLRDGKPVRAKALMALRIVAHPVHSGRFAITVQGAAFGDDVRMTTHQKCPDNTCPTYKKVFPPDYPQKMDVENVSGVVYALLQVNRQGRVTNAAIRQVDLHNHGVKSQLADCRRAFGEATLAAVRKWTFNVPNTGPFDKRGFLIIQVPVNFSIVGSRPAEIGYGQWNSYVPGPVHAVAWADSADHGATANGSADAIPDNGKPFVSDPRFVLLTPLGGNAVGQPKAGTTGQG